MHFACNFLIEYASDAIQVVSRNPLNDVALILAVKLFELQYCHFALHFGPSLRLHYNIIQVNCLYLEQEL